MQKLELRTALPEREKPAIFHSLRVSKPSTATKSFCLGPSAPWSLCPFGPFGPLVPLPIGPFAPLSPRSAPFSLRVRVISRAITHVELPRRGPGNGHPDVVEIGAGFLIPRIVANQVLRAQIVAYLLEGRVEAA